MKRVCLSCWVLLAVAFTASAAQVEHQRHHPPEATSEYIRILEDPGREKWQEPDRVVKALGLRPGESVADLGAGSGYFTVRLAKAVGPSGKVFAVDINPGMLAHIRQRAKEEGLKNLTTVLADPHDPKLPARSVDLIFICDTLHHITDRGSYYPLLARALKPGGRLVDVDFQKRPLPLGPPLGMKIARSALIEEVKPAGFRLVKEYDFLPYQYFLVFAH
jgi:arsenite methyltransferase